MANNKQTSKPNLYLRACVCVYNNSKEQMKKKTSPHLPILSLAKLFRPSSQGSRHNVLALHWFGRRKERASDSDGVELERSERERLF